MVIIEINSYNHDHSNLIIERGGGASSGADAKELVWIGGRKGCCREANRYGIGVG